MRKRSKRDGSGLETPEGSGGLSACATMLESDGIEQEIMRISIGYCAEGGSPAGQLWAGRRQI